MGIVTEVNPEDSLRPKVEVIFTKFGKQRFSPFPVDLAQEFKEMGSDPARMIVAQDPRHRNINIEDWLATPM